MAGGGAEPLPPPLSLPWHKLPLYEEDNWHRAQSQIIVSATQKDAVVKEIVGSVGVTRVRASLVHLGVSASIALVSALGVFFLWYPYPYSDISGGRELFFWVAGVDVVMGPLITSVVFNPRKIWRELRLDLAIIGVLQLSALAYGVWTVYQARPVALVYEYDRLSVVHAVDIDPVLLAKAPQAASLLPAIGPGLVALRPFKDNAEQMQTTLAALSGAPLAARVDLWQSYGRSVPEILQHASPAADLLHRFPQLSEAIEEAVQRTGLSIGDLRVLPLLGRKSYWTVFLNASTGYPVGYLAVDSF